MALLVILSLISLLSGCSNGNSVEVAKAKSQADQFLAQQNFTAAVAPLRKVVRLQPDTPGVLSDLARSVMHSENRQTLLQEATDTLSKKPEDIEALTIAAGALMGKDDEKKRLDYLRSLVRLRPKDMLFKVTLAQELVNSYFYEEARPLLEDLITIAPNDPAAYFMRGKVNYFQTPTPAGLAQAETDFKKVLAFHSNLPQTYLYLGRVLLLQGKPAEAIEQLAEAAKLTPDSPDVHFELAKAFRAAGDPEMAAKAQAAFVRFREQATLTEAMAKRCVAFPDDFALQLKTAMLMMKKGDSDKAETYLSNALSLRPNDPDALAVAKQLNTVSTENAAP
jgi:Flp pilus assembly protein TadD